MTVFWLAYATAANLCLVYMILSLLRDKRLVEAVLALVLLMPLVYVGGTVVVEREQPFATTYLAMGRLLQTYGLGELGLLCLVAGFAGFFFYRLYRGRRQR